MDATWIDQTEEENKIKSELFLFFPTGPVHTGAVEKHSARALWERASE